MVHVAGAFDAWRGVEVFRVHPEVFVLVDGAAVAFEVGVADSTEPIFIIRYWLQTW
jgi:hypothetical protein